MFVDDSTVMTPGASKYLPIKLESIKHMTPFVPKLKQMLQQFKTFFQFNDLAAKF